MRRFSDSVQVRVREQEQSARGRQGGLSSVGRPAGTPGQVESIEDETIEDESAGSAPEAFIWRGRLYVVRGVLGQWRERRAWWRDALEADEAQVRPGETLVAAASEQHVWRVEARPGWSFAPGVYDLAHDESPRGDQWSLVRVAD